MTVNLASVVDTYLKDTDFQDASRRIIAKREASIPTLKRIVTEFVDGLTDLKSFRELFDKALHTEDDWGATGTGFLMEINKLAKYHAENNTSTEERFRQTLSGLNAGNLGQRIEQFYMFLMSERERLRQAGRSSGMIVSPANCAYIISLFAFWLDRPGQPVMYYLSLRRGLKMLLEVGAIPRPAGLQVVGDRVEVRSDADHQAVLQAMDSLAIAAPKLRIKTDAYGTERFLYWITENPSILEETGRVEEITAVQKVIGHEPLIPTPEPLITRLVAEVRRHILVDQAVIRRIYHALLAGHVILTGPPGTGKTELARLIPEILWRSEEGTGSDVKATAYTTMLVTATDEWSTRTLIGGIAPNIYSGQVSYRIQHGYLTSAILKNWVVDPDDTANWRNAQRVSLRAPSVLDQGEIKEFRGHWLVIDEFNRAPIDIALGEALTSLGGSETLRVAVDSGSAELPLPKDFRIIGMLNSFDRNYLNQISEALKRRFAFIEVLPPSRAQRDAEQAIVLYKAFSSIEHLGRIIAMHAGDIVSWHHENSLHPDDPVGIYRTDGVWGDDVLHEAFEAAWRVFEVIRIYRQLGTAQVITLIRHMLIAGLMENYAAKQYWITALDTALCDTIADQLQVLLPDELEILLWYLKLEKDAFINKYNDFLGKLVNSPRRLRAQLEALSAVVDNSSNPFLTEDQVEHLAEQEKPQIAAEALTAIFHLDQPRYALPQFIRRLRTFKAERGL